MDADLRLDVEHPERVLQAVGPDLQDSDRVSYETDTANGQVLVHVEAASLGVLRGALNTVTRLTKLSTKFDSADD